MIHPAGKGCLFTDEIQAFFDQGNGTEQVAYGHAFRHHVPDPDQTIAFDPIPDHVLQVQVTGVGRCVKNLVQIGITALKTAFIRIIPVNKNRQNGFQRHSGVR